MQRVAIQAVETRVAIQETLITLKVTVVQNMVVHNNQRSVSCFSD